MLLLDEQLASASRSSSCVSAPPARSVARARGKSVAPQAPEDVWLSRIGTGPAQTARVCGRGATDRVATALCDKADAADPRPRRSLSRAAARPDPAERLVAATVTFARAVGADACPALNPRVLVYQDISHKRRPVTYEEVVVAGFTRGEQLVELAALDPATYEYNFYLLRFEQACNRTRCTPEDLLTEKIESGWTDWTLYSERDLEDTALDCVSCHLPFGPGTHKQLLMRQVVDPWMHWSDFRGRRRAHALPDFAAGRQRRKGRRDRRRPRYPARGRGHRGPLRGRARGRAARGGEREGLGKFRRGRRGADSRQPLSPPTIPTNSSVSQTREVVCERFHTGTSPTWDRQRRESLERGLPVPYYGPTSSTPSAAPRSSPIGPPFCDATRPRTPSTSRPRSSPPRSPAQSASFRARRTRAPEILRAMCVRCHAAGDGSAPPARPVQRRGDRSIASRPSTATAIRRRLSLPKSSPELMPPCASASCRPGRSPGSNATCATAARTPAPAIERATRRSG